MLDYQANTNFIIVPIQRKDDESLAFLAKDPVSHKTLELGIKEYFLYQSLVANLSLDDICTKFYTQFQTPVAPADVSSFARSMMVEGLIQKLGESARSESDKVSEDPLRSPLSNDDFSLDLPDVSALGRSDLAPENNRKRLFNPQRLFLATSWIDKPLTNLYWALIVGFPTALLTLFHHSFNFWQDSIVLAQKVPWIGSLLLGIWGINLASKLVQGATVVAMRGAVNELGMSLLLGWVPLFYIRYPGVLGFSRAAQLKIFAAPLLFRLLVFTAGILFWICMRGSANFLPLMGLMVSQATLPGLLLDASPTWKSNGYRCLSIYLRSPRLFDRAWQIFEMLIVRRSRPAHLSAHQKRVLIIYGLLALLSWIGLFAVAVGALAIELEANLSGVGVILFLVLFALTIRWGFSMIRPSLQGSGGEGAQQLRQTAITSSAEKFVPSDPVWRWLENHKYSVIGGLSLLCLSTIPYPYRPGGPVELLTPQQLDIQANISGKVEAVYVQGGTGEIIEEGTIIASIQPSQQIYFGTPIENDRAVSQERIASYEATLSQRQAELDELLSTPRPENVEIAQKSVETAEANLAADRVRLEVIGQEAEVAKQKLATLEQEIAVAQRQIETAMISVDYDQREADRLRSLYDQGGITLQNYENSVAAAETSRARLAEAEERLLVSRQQVAEQQQTIAVINQRMLEQQQNIRTLVSQVEKEQSELALVKQGPHPEEIKAARQGVASAEANLREQQKNLEGIDEQLEENQIEMPFTGQITTPFLDQKVGTYVAQGDTFASIENTGKIQGMLSIPESEANFIEPGSTVQVKLSAYANRSFEGRVLSIEPTTSEERDRRFINVIVEIADSKELITGMSGYAKIEGQKLPLIVAFSRPVVRFLQVEVWSWIP